MVQMENDPPLANQEKLLMDKDRFWQEIEKWYSKMQEHPEAYKLDRLIEDTIKDDTEGAPPPSPGEPSGGS